MISSDSIASPTGIDLNNHPEHEPGEDGLTRLHPNHMKVLRISTAIFCVPFVIVALILEVSSILPTGVIIAPVVITAFFAILRIPMRRHLARGFAMSDDRLRVVRGILFRSDTIVPFGRVQHIDVHRGPIERAFGIATLTVHTAGSHNASVHLPGLKHELALEMREQIRAHIKRDAM